MPQRLTLTDQAIRRFAVPATASTAYWDTLVDGFGVRVWAGGAKTFMVLIGSGRRQAIGRYPRLSLSDARTEAKRILAEKTLGKVRPLHTAFDDAKRDFLTDSGKRNKPRTVREYSRLLNRHFAFGRKSVADITSHEIVRALNKLNDTPAEKHHVFTAARAFFRWSLRQYIVDRNPMERIYVSPPKSSRERVLTSKELPSALRLALSAPSTFYGIVALLVLTGQRRGEIAALQWNWIDLDKQHITLPKTVTKNKRVHTFPIGDMAVQVFEKRPRLKDNPYVFPAAHDRYKDKPATVFNGWGKPKARFDEQLKIEPWTLHDLRRTFRTMWAELAISREIAERYINHVSGVHSGIQAVYDRHKYMDEMRTAVTMWETHLQTLLHN